ncbi:uncharacterized protein PHACADRAFT_154569 [Phanerochaete carnosa HHB-10118-sp]|uniref:Protein kinase domain-containing protein n=1 Tax=Phanerochaete carnosa (strain HHB-10118-sp) TaxID=650164 RepID=K5VT09_PHACS|nr:uncharacterized protein PHACADRAFT_154569 [Phanerochaete carnosa HHB-10118-sp]EKM49915.1 hypothetical protein PHACADRAFT_154569 [Phanerochaete carnosa HHB-10118-sp]
MVLELSCWLLAHERVIHLYGVTNKYAAPGLVFDWAENGNGMDYIRELLEHPRKVQVPIIRNVADGLKFIHDEGVVHGDLKAANVLIHADNRAVLADFGLSRFARGHPSDYDPARLGSLRWCAPELQNEGQARATFESDMFAFGMLCLEVCLLPAPLLHAARD